MIATTRPLLALTASDLMSPGVVTVSQDTPLGEAAELLFRRQVGEAAVVDSDGRCVGTLSATALIRWALGEAGGADGDAPPPVCSYQVKGRLLTGEDAVICMRVQGSCPMQELRAMTGGRHTAVCLLRGGLVSDWQQVPAGVPAGAVRRHMNAGVGTVGSEAHLSALARAVVDAHAHSLIVVDEQHRPIGAVSQLDVLAALARPARSAAGG